MKLRSSFSRFSFLFLLLFIHPLIFADLNSDQRALLDFASKVLHSPKLNWTASSSVCGSWVGVTCSRDKTSVVAIRLPGAGLLGSLPLGTIGKLDALRILSLRSNQLTGNLPSDIPSIPSLQYLFLQNNNFSGTIPYFLSPKLVALDLSSNSFTGEIPSSIQILKKLIILELQDNLLSGEIPEINLPAVKFLNFSHNELSGSIPHFLQRFPRSSFIGNSLCGPPLAHCAMNATSPSLSPSPSPSNSISSPKTNLYHTKKFSTGAIIAVVIGSSSVLFLAIMIFLLCCFNRKDNAARKGKASDGKKNQIPSESFGSGVQTGEKNKLVFFEGCNYNFDLEDLLRASAEVLGKGSYGTTYKADLDAGVTVVVKRLKEVGVGKKEFEQNMEMVSELGRHANVVALRAYYYSKDEKLLVYDYIGGGSLSAAVHGNDSNGRPTLNWNSRLKVALGAARGLLHIHSHGGGGKYIHGNLKSSNVLITDGLDGCISDFGLTLLMNFQGMSPRTIGYHSPELIESRKASQKSDVYSFGVVLLELLTGKAPFKGHQGHGGVVDLPRWVQSVVREEWTSEVFDSELIRTSPNAEEEMVQLLQIALACVTRAPDARPTMEDVVRMVEEIRPYELEDRPSSEENKSKVSTTPTP